MDMNDRALRAININTKGVAKDFPREDGFDITSSFRSNGNFLSCK